MNGLAGGRIVGGQADHQHVEFIAQPFYLLLWSEMLSGACVTMLYSDTKIVILANIKLLFLILVQCRCDHQ